MSPVDDYDSTQTVDLTNQVGVGQNNIRFDVQMDRKLKQLSKGGGASCENLNFPPQSPNYGNKMLMMNNAAQSMRIVNRNMDSQTDLNKISGDTSVP